MQNYKNYGLVYLILFTNPTIFLKHRNKTKIEVPDEPDIENNYHFDNYYLRKYNFFSELGIGLQWPLAKRLNMQFRPSGRFQLLSAMEESVNNSRLFAWGINLGINYSLHDNSQ